MAGTYLSATASTTLFVEMDRVEGRDPPDRALDHFEAVIDREVTASHEILLDDTLAPRDDDGDTTYSVSETREIADASRDRSSSSDIATMHLVVLDGSSSDARDALGMAIDASTIILFADRIDDAGTLFLPATDVWRSVLVHELGHLFGLVELVEPSRTDRHEDPDHRGHSPSRDSVMYWAIEDAGIASILGERPPDDFDEDDRADLAAFRGR